MAGIGFELRRIFGKKTLLSRARGVVYASMVSVGPSLIFIVMLLSIRSFMQYYGATELENLFYTASFTYAFLIAILVSACMNTVVSRYISDKIFEGIESDICASMFGVLTIGTIASGVLAGILCVAMYFTNQIPVSFLIVYYLLVVLATNVYNLVTYISALKEYKKVTIAYFVGMLVTLLLFFVLYKGLHCMLLQAVYVSLTSGYIVILMMLVWNCVKAFGKPSEKYFEFLGYLKKYPYLFFGGIAYTGGFYISNIIYWLFSDMSIQISIFRIAPNYDMALFLGMLGNLSGMIIFQVKTETVFYEKHLEYLSALQKGTYDLIETKREALQNTINLQLFFLYEVQLIITIIFICVVNVVYPYLGISNKILNLLLLLGMGVYCIFSMYFTVIFLYYFEDHKSALWGTTVFFVVVVIGSVICCFIGEPSYPLPVLVGGIAGWVVSFHMLRKRLANLNAYLLCR